MALTIASGGWSQLIAAAEPNVIEILEFGQTRLLFSYGPTCRFIMPSIHVYSVSRQKFLGGDELGPALSALADIVSPRVDSGQDCPAEVSQDGLVTILGDALPDSDDQVVFFVDVPGTPPFELFSDNVRARRDELLGIFAGVDGAAKVHLITPDIR